MIVGTLPEVDGGRIYNTAVGIGPSGCMGSQRKIHLGTYEKGLFQQGSTFAPIRIADALVGIITCFDSWFPEMSRLLVR